MNNFVRALAYGNNIMLLVPSFSAIATIMLMDYAKLTMQPQWIHKHKKYTNHYKTEMAVHSKESGHLDQMEPQLGIVTSILGHLYQHSFPESSNSDKQTV